MKSSEKRVLHVLSQQPGKTGSGVFLQAIVRQAALKLYSQRVVVGMPFVLPHPEISGLSADSIFPVRFDTPELPFPVAGMSDIMPYVSTRFSTFSQEMLSRYLKSFQRTLQLAVEGFTPDIIHTHHLWLVTALVRRMFPEIPVVTTCHGTEFRQLGRAPHLIPYVLPDCSRVHAAMALHPYQFAQIRDIYGVPAHRIHVVGAGYREDIFCRAGDEARDDTLPITLQVAYAGKISRPKGVPWLIEALSHVVIPDGCRLAAKFAGSTGDADAVDMSCAVHRPDCQMEFVGALSQEALADVLRASQVFVLPSFFEGLPLVVLEALACGCRVVVTDLPGLDTWLPPDLEENGFVERVPMPRLIRTDEPVTADLPEFVKNLSAAISRQLERSHRRASEGNSCVASCVQALGWRSIFEKIEHVYRDAIQQRMAGTFSS